MLPLLRPFPCTPDQDFKESTNTPLYYHPGDLLSRGLSHPSRQAIFQPPMMGLSPRTAWCQQSGGRRSVQDGESLANHVQTANRFRMSHASRRRHGFCLLWVCITDGDLKICDMRDRPERGLPCKRSAIDKQLAKIDRCGISFALAYLGASNRLRLTFRYSPVEAVFAPKHHSPYWNLALLKSHLRPGSMFP